jgi:putative hemolysin
MLNIQGVLEERYPRFVQRHRRISRTLARFLGLLFYEPRFQQFARDYPHLEGFDFVDETLRYFDFTLRLRDSERARIPSSGRVVIVANHPIGSLDGLALLSLVRQVRPDVKVVANELLSALKPLHPVLLPVNNMGGNTGRSNLKNIRAHLQQDGALIIFPAGEVSRFGATGIRDGEWHSGFIKFARATGSPVLPIFVAGRNSLFFYSLSFLARPLSTLWLVREMFKQSHNTVDARVGNAVPTEHYEALGASAPKLAALFRKHVYRLARNGRPVFQSVETVAHPENRLLLKREVEASEWLGETPDGKQIHVCDMAEAPCVMRELGRLREIAFRAVGEGTNLPRDIDRHDRDYRQLILWDPVDLEIAGGYRLGEARQLLSEQGWNGLYSHSLFRIDASLRPRLEQGLELGRSFVQHKYQSKHSLDYLWMGIGAYIRKYPRFRYLFGPASVSQLYGKKAMARLAWFYGTFYSDDDIAVRAREPFEIEDAQLQDIEAEFEGCDLDTGFKRLRQSLSEQGLSVPTLYKHYAQAAEPEGVCFAAFNVDRGFNDCVDAFVIVDLEQLKPRKRKRYLDQGEANHGGTQT